MVELYACSQPWGTIRRVKFWTSVQQEGLFKVIAIPLMLNINVTLTVFGKTILGVFSSNFPGL